MKQSHDGISPSNFHGCKNKTIKCGIKTQRKPKKVI